MIRFRSFPLRSGLALASCAWLTLATTALGQKLSIPTNEEVVVTATRIPERLSQSTLNTTVISAADIAASGQQSLVDLLQARGGVQITNSGGLGQPGAVLIRGAEPRHTLVLIDGLRISSATAGMTAFEHLPLSQIERIEIVASPLSSVYGSDAIGGVIQIFTRSATGFNASVGTGSFGTHESRFSIGHSFEQTDVSFSLGVLESNGFDSTRRTIPFGQHHPDADGYRNAALSARLAHHFSDRHEFGLTAFQSEGNTHFDAGLATDDVNRQTLSAYSAYLRNQIASGWASLLRLGTTRDKSVTIGAFPGYFQTDQHQALWQNEFKLGPGTLLAGYEYLDQRVASDTVFKQTGRTVSSLFAGYSGGLGNHTFQASARHDDSSQFGGQNTGSLGYSYRFNPNLRVRAGAGTAFKAPSFNDLYFPDFAPFFFSNPQLRPERSRGRELGMDVTLGKHNAAITVFENNVTDLITIFTDPLTFVSTTRNLNQARIRGLEATYAGQWFGWTAGVRANFHDPVDVSNGLLLRRRAQQFGSLTLNRRMGAWQVGAEVTASGRRYDSTTEAANTRLHGYGLLNLSVGYTLSKRWTLNTRLNNAFDRDYETVQFFNTPGRNLHVWLAYKF